VKRLFARLFPPRGRHREPREAVSPRHICTRACDRAYGVDYLDEGCPDADPATPTVHLPAVLHPHPWHGATAVLSQSAGRQPTPDDCPPRTEAGTVDHVGATEDFATVLAEMRHDLAHDSGGLDPESVAWEEELAALDRRLAQHRLDFARRWRDIVAPMAERVAPGWYDEPPVAVANFAEARKLATGEIPVVVA